MKDRIKCFFDLAQELEEVCVNDDFLTLLEEVNKEQDMDEKYNLADVLSFVSDVDDALKHSYSNMSHYYEDY